MRTIFLLFAAAFLLSCKTKSPKPEAGWSGPMQNMAADVRQLIPYLYDRRAFDDPKNHDVILKSLKDFAQAAHKLDPEKGKVYGVKLTLADDGRKLNVRGFLGVSLLGRTQTWLRETDPAAATPSTTQP